MRKAAMGAGLIPSLDSPALVLATEPEAAALTCQQHKELLGLAEGRRLLVLDLGGGTVDMSLHTVDALLGGTDGLSLSEVTYRECLPEGATRVDERFQTHLASLLGHDACTDWVKDPANAPDVQELLCDEWETCKRAFDGTGTTRVNLPASLCFSAPDDALQRLEAAGASDSVLLPAETMPALFTPSLEAVAAKAAAMLERAGGADVAVLVGGFGSSRFVAAYMKRRLAIPTLEMSPLATRPRLCWRVSGVWFAHYPGAIAARRSKMAYGIRTAVPWRHGAPDRTWIEHKQAYRCVFGFAPYVKADELVKVGSVVSRTFSPLYPRQRSVAFDIYGCLSNSARYTTEPTMKKIATTLVEFPEPCGSDPDEYVLTAHFNFGEAAITVRCVDEQTGREACTSLAFDSGELLDRAELSAVVA